MERVAERLWRCVADGVGDDLECCARVGGEEARDHQPIEVAHGAEVGAAQSDEPVGGVHPMRLSHHGPPVAPQRALEVDDGGRAAKIREGSVEGVHVPLCERVHWA